MLLAVSLWLAAPVIVAGGLHIALIKVNVWPRLAALPLDGRRSLRGRRVFGDNKTVRGVVLMMTCTLACTLLQHAINARAGWAAALTDPAVDAVSPFVWGLLLGGGYVLGELPNSFIKRQLDIAPGEAARGWTTPLFWVADQIDSLIGVLIAMTCVWTPPLHVVVTLLAVTLVVHPLAALCMVSLGLKNRVG
ncbi:MAG: CDP-archaeol synthase [Acidobacteria bacterium]|nr:CDP-archaeol synthase [Acidobacteriota bacterium]